MLEIRANCELCDVDLPPHSKEARICSYECTYCRNCAETVLKNVCPTCGGGFERRPVRPHQSHRGELKLGLEYHPASKKRYVSKWTTEQIETLVNGLKEVPPEQR